MRGQIAPFDIGILLIALVIFVIGTALLSWFVNVRSEISIKFMYETNEAYRLLLSLLSLNYSSKSVYEMISTFDYNKDENFISFLNESLLQYFDLVPKCYKVTLGSKTILEFKKKEYSGDCYKTRFSAAVPIFTPYNNAKLIEYLYLNYEEGERLQPTETTTKASDNRVGVGR
jgi:hypothetical protein